MGQFFGKNKVQYEDFDFEVMRTPHFEVHYYEQNEKSIEEVCVILENWYERYSALFGHSFKRKKPVIIYADHPDFQQTQIISGLIDVGVGGVTEGLKTRMVMPIAESWGSTNHVLGHELAHVFQFDMLESGDSAVAAGSIGTLPLWMIEGMAEYLTLGHRDEMTALWMRDAVDRNRIPTVTRLGRDYSYSPYRYGHSLWAFITGTWGDEVIPKLFRRVPQVGFKKAFKNVLGVTVDSLSVMWKQELEKTYRPILESKGKKDKKSRKVISFEDGSGKYNLGPVISPDGKKVVFMSEKDIFTIDLFVADASTGKILTKLKGNTGAQFDAVNFLKSSGSWSPDSRKVAVSLVRKGDHQVGIIDANTGRLDTTIAFDNVSAIYDVEWSPDGDKLVLSGANGGMTDLYLYNFKTGEVRQLTNDQYADIQPEWSSDGSKILFVTDRGDGELYTELVREKMKIAEYDLEDSTVSIIPLFEEGKHIDPEFTPDGKGIYFVANPDGISNVYEYDFDTGEKTRITDVSIGVVGLTSLSTCFSMADKTGDMVYSTFQNGQYKIYRVDVGDVGPAEPSQVETMHGNYLPPVERAEEVIVAEYLKKMEIDTMILESFSSRDYRPRLMLDYIMGGAYVDGSTGGFSSEFVGGVNLFFSDMLSDHRLFTALQVSGRLKDAAGLVQYINSKKRIHWGGLVSHIPYVSSFTTVSRDTLVDGNNKTNVYVFDKQIFRIFEDRIIGLARYPFNMNTRLDFSAGYTRLSYSREVERTITTTDFFILDEEDFKLDAPEPVNQVHTGAAHVIDKAFYGFTAPLRGYRHRIELEPQFGTFEYVGFSFDHRFYVRKEPVTFAFRVLHFGRYFGDSEDDDLGAIYLGSEYFMRGYAWYSISSSECGEDVGRCPVYDRLNGSKVAAANFEIRLPFTGHPRLALIKSRFFLTSLSLFGEAGVAWYDHEPPTFKFATESNERIPVFSAGLSFRMNLGGALILELYGAVPFQRPDKDVAIGFVILPGW